MTALAIEAVEPRIRRDTHYGIQVLRAHVDDPIPSPRAPERYAVLVNPDLARYWLTLNHPENRKKKPTAITKYTRDMLSGSWTFTPESLVFSHSGVLQNGQNRLYAVIESGAPTWMMVDFGWPEDLLQTIDRGSARTNSDSLTVEAVPNASVMAGAFTLSVKYQRTFGTPLRWSVMLPTSSEALAGYRDEPDMWAEAISVGRSVYDATQGLGPSTWTAAAFVIGKVRGMGDAVSFLSEVRDETGEAGSATRRLKSHYLRRKITDTSSGDPREPMENIIRAFNAWVTGKPVGFVRTGGAFVLTAVRKR